MKKLFIFFPAALLVITFLAAVLRFWQLGTVPTSVNADEAALGYNAYSILKTSKDEYGRRFPLSFQSFDDFKRPVYVYLTVPGVAVFGLNDFSVRLPSAILGTLTVLVTYYLVAGLFGSSAIALLASLLLAISPWHLQFSRSAYEANIAVFFLILGMTWLLKGMKARIYFIPGFISLSLSVWSYHSSLIFVPLLLIGFVAIYFPEIKKNLLFFLSGAIIMALMCAPLVLLSFSPEGLVRARGVSALDNGELQRRNVSWKQLDGVLNNPFPAIYHNQRLVTLSVILKGYLTHYNPNFFFSEIVQGKYHAPGVGLMYLWELPILIYGLYVIGSIKGKGKYLLFVWFLAAPVAAAPTQNLPQPVRTLVFLPTVQIFAAAALVELYRRLESVKKIRRYLVGVGGVVIIVSTMYYLHQYYIHAPVDYAKDWQYGHEEVVRTVSQMQGKFDKVIVSTQLDVPYIFFLYYLKYDPVTYLTSGGTKSGKFDEQRNAFDKYEFHTFMQATGSIDPRVLYVGIPTEQPPGTQPLVTIKYPDGSDAYVLSGIVNKKDWNNAGNQPYLE